VVLHETVRDGVVRAEILGPKRSRTVTFVRKIDEVLPFTELERPDPKLPKGARVLSQRGIPGFRTHRYRIVRDGAFAVRERWNDSYPPTSQIVRVGTADSGDADDVADDPHPEYVADDYLVLMQGADVTPGGAPGGGGMVEAREPGRTGEYGWTERAGFSHYVPRKKGRGDAGCTGDCPPDENRDSSERKVARRGERDRDRGRAGERERDRGRAGEREHRTAREPTSTVLADRKPGKSRRREGERARGALLR
jgi:hypothetical protein